MLLHAKWTFVGANGMSPKGREHLSSRQDAGRGRENPRTGCASFCECRKGAGTRPAPTAGSLYLRDADVLAELDGRTYLFAEIGIELGRAHGHRLDPELHQFFLHGRDRKRLAGLLEEAVIDRLG